MKTMNSEGQRSMHSALLVVVLLVVAAGSAGFGFVWNVDRTVNDHLTRVDGAFPAESGRPAASGEIGGRRPMTLLFLGSNALPDSARATGVSADTVMVIRLAADRQRVDVVSLPGDALVDIPGFGRDRLSSATTRGGMPLAVETVEQLLHVRMDHVGVLDLDGVAEVTDAVGGVDLTVERPFRAGAVDYAPGVHHLDGQAATAIVREQRSLPGRDLDRAQHQQAFVAALVDKLTSTGTIADPIEIREILAVAADNAAVDAELDPSTLRGLVISLRNLRAEDVHFWTAPVESVTSQGAGPLTVQLSEDGIGRLTVALRDDGFEAYQG